jgi:N-acetylmuramoyl-L-alanine amidase
MRSIRASFVRRLIVATAIVLSFVATTAYAKPEASGARAGLQDGGVTRFVLDLSEQIDVRVQTYTTPNRIIVETPDLAWVGGGFSKPLGPFKDVRFARQGAGGRILIDLVEPVSVKTAFVIPPRQGFNWRLVIDVVPASVAVVRAAKPIEVVAPKPERASTPQTAQAPVAPERAAAPPKPGQQPVQQMAQVAPRVAEAAPSVAVAKPLGHAQPATQTSSFVITSPVLSAPPPAPAPTVLVARTVLEEARPSLSPVSSAIAAPVVPAQVVSAPPVTERKDVGVRSVSMPLPPATRADRSVPEARPTLVAAAASSGSAAPRNTDIQRASLPLQQQPDTRAREPEPRKQAKKPDDVRVVVIDPGHGGVDPGALSISGVYEKNITLGVAQAVKTELEKRGRYRVVLTRDRDIFIPLRDRVKIARQAGADLFISLHADSVGNPGIRGLSVYTLSEHASDSEAAALAEKENKVDLIAGLDLSHESPEVTNILIDLTQRETMNRSASFAQGMVGELSEVTTLLSNSHRFAGFAVLKAPDVPSVLIELGYLSNKEEEPLLRQAAYRAKLAAALSRSVERYFANPVKGKRS